MMQATEECCSDYDSKEEEMELLRHEFDLKEMKVGSMRSLIKENAWEVDAKAETLGSMMRPFNECPTVVEIKKKKKGLSRVHSLLVHNFEERGE